MRRKNIMLCYPFEPKRLDNWHLPWLVQPKLDGLRCRAVLEDGQWKLISSEGNSIVSLPHIVDSLNVVDSFDHTIQELDGELYVHGMAFEDIISRSKRLELHPDFASIEYHIFDVPSLPTNQFKRLEILQSLIPDYIHLPLHIVPWDVCWTLEEVMASYEKWLSQGYEGMVVKNAWCKYERRRSVNWMKFKPKKRDVYRIVGWKEEVDKYGRPKGRLGALVCTGQDGHEFSVGSGLTDALRQKLWNKRNELPGKWCLVEYQHITPGRGVPRFPIFVSVIEEGHYE